MPTRPLRAVAVAMAALAVSGAACTSSPEQNGGSRPSPSATPTPTVQGTAFTGHGVSFSYPKGWKEFKLTGSSASAGNVDWEKTVGLDGRNIVSVAQYTLDISITDANIQGQTDSIGSQIQSLFAQAGGSMTDGPTRQQIGGLPALSFAGTVKTPNGRTVHTRLLLAFDGTTEYAVNCQYDDQARTDVESACDQVASTFMVAG